MDIKHEFDYTLFKQRNAYTEVPDYDEETIFYNSIADGNLDKVNEIKEVYFQQRRSFGEEGGKLSSDKSINRKYYFVMLAATIMRFCIAAGLDRESAFAICSVYINKADAMTNLKKIDDLEMAMIVDFTKRMQENRKKNAISKQVSRCIDYIYKNLHHKITVAEIAKHLDMTPSYLSKLFAKEMGTTVSAHIKEQRLIAAAKMLTITDYSISEISEYFVFSSQSHFTSDFQKKFNMTPKKYRDAHFSNHKPIHSEA